MKEGEREGRGGEEGKRSARALESRSPLHLAETRAVEGRGGGDEQVYYKSEKRNENKVSSSSHSLWRQNHRGRP